MHVFCLNVGASGLASPSSVLTVFVRASGKSLMSKWCVFYTWRCTAVRKCFCKYQTISWSRPVRTANSWEYLFTKTSDNKSMPTHLKQTETSGQLGIVKLEILFAGRLCHRPGLNSFNLCKKEMADTDTIGQCLSELRVLQKSRG